MYIGGDGREGRNFLGFGIQFQEGGGGAVKCASYAGESYSTV